MQQINPSIFKAYDIRGIYPDEFDVDVAYRIARAFVQKLKPGVIAVGRDMRTSGPELLEPVIKGLTDQGADVIDIGMVSTPMYYYAVNALKVDAGVMITASHNPSKYNGFKLTGPEARPSVGFMTNEELYALANSGVFETPARTGVVRDHVSPLDDYVKAILATSGIKDFGGLKIAIDAGNGMDGIILPKLFEGKNCTVYPLYWEPDGTFPNHEANPLKEETLTDLKAKIAEVGADIGVAYDGDGDRVGFVDETGCVVQGDMITALIAIAMLKEHPGATIMYDLRSSWSVKEEIEKAGGKPFMYKVGHGLIKTKMRENGALFAGELSSHYYFSNFYITDNADLAMLKIVQLMVDEGKKLSELVAPILRYHHSPEINSKVSDVQGKIAEIKEKYKDGKQIELDGLTVEYDDWWFNLRASQTEPLIRLNVEAKTKEMMDAKVEELLALIRS